MLREEDLKEIIDIGVEITDEKDENCLLDKILETVIRITNCDAGTLYLNDNNVLSFKIMKIKSLNISIGGDGKAVDLPPIQMSKENIIAYSVIHKELVRIDDTSKDKRFRFDNDKETGYTNYEIGSMLVLPLINSQEDVVGALQLINAFDDVNNIVPFSQDAQYTIKTIGSLAAIAITNIKYIYEIKSQMESFVDAFTMAIDERTPYNGMHSKKVKTYVELMADYINSLHYQGLCDDYFTKEDKDQLIMAASLHDIGKMVVPLSVMNKSTRLEGSIREIKSRFKLIMAYLEIDFLKGKISKEKYQKEITYIKENFEKIRVLNNSSYIDEDELKFVEELGNKRYIGEDGKIIEYLTPYEKECLMIQRGTLTESERNVMKSHVVMTERLLDKVHFGSRFSKVKEIARSHHELLDGSGYPNGLKAEDLSLETRILTVVDIFDALTSPDRPYKSPVDIESAFDILENMADNGKIEKRLVEYLHEIIKKVG